MLASAIKAFPTTESHDPGGNIYPFLVGDREKEHVLHQGQGGCTEAHTSAQVLAVGLNYLGAK